MQTSLKFLAMLALAMLAVGCSDLEKKEGMARDAGFKVITPHTPDQVALLAMLPPKMSLLNYNGSPVYVLPNAQKNRAHVGRLPQYEAYQRIRETHHLEDDIPGIPHMAALNFGGWDGAQVLGP